MTKNKIREVAMNSFAMKGYEETSLSMIANAVGIKTPSIYAFYKSKEDLFLEALHEVLFHHYKHIERAAESLPSEPTEKRLFQILKEMYTYHLREEEKTTFYLRFILFPPSGLEVQIHQEFIKSDEFLSEILDEIFTLAIQKGEIKEIEIASLIAGFLCLMDGLFIQLFYYRSNAEELNRRLKTVWAIYWEGIKK